MEVPSEVLSSGGVVPVKYTRKGKDAGIETLSKKELKKAQKEEKKAKKEAKEEKEK